MVFALLWGVILFALILMTSFDSFLEQFDNGILLKVFAITSALGIITTILCKKKMKPSWMLPLLLIVSTIITTTINYGLLYITSDYISVYTKEKWERYPDFRYCMLDHLQEQYEFIGMTEQSLKEILGEPTSIVEYTGNTKHQGFTAYQYLVGDDKIDGYTYDFIFKNGLVVDTAISQR